MILIWPDNMWFQQDNARCLDVFYRFGDQNWPPRSYDLRPLDFLLWGYLKSKVYTNKPTSTAFVQNDYGELRQYYVCASKVI